jgi:hypothetical protein
MSERKVSLAINVNTAQELAEAGPHVKSFLKTVKADDFDISVAVNPLIELEARERPPAIGFIAQEDEVYYEDDEEDGE